MVLGTGNRARVLSPQLENQQTNARVSRKTRQNLVIIGALATLDTVAVCAAFGTAYLVRFKTEWSIFYAHSDAPLDFYSNLVFWLVPMVIVAFAFYRLYSPQQIFDDAREYIRIGSAATLSMLLVILVSFFFDGDLVISRGWVVASWMALILFVAGGRFLARHTMYELRARGYVSRRIAIVAEEGDAEELRDRFLESPESGIHVVRLIYPASIENDLPAALEGTGLRDAIERDDIEEIVVSSASVNQPVLARIVRELAQLPTMLHIVPGMYEIQTTGVNAHEIRGLPLVTLNKVRITGLDFVLKRMLDYVVSGATLVVLSPVLITLAIMVKLTSPGPVFHRRRVLGERGRPFDALKFRTMYVDGDAILERHPELLARLQEHGKLEDDPRITPVGRWLRRWSLDEFPQLLNVLVGQMSLVGPRMITPTELDRFGHWRDNLITVKPGLTGLWQVSGRSNLEYADRVRLDMYYIRNYSIWQDLDILFRTVPAVFKGIGAY